MSFVLQQPLYGFAFRILKHLVLPRENLKQTFTKNVAPNETNKSLYVLREAHDTFPEVEDLSPIKVQEVHIEVCSGRNGVESLIYVQTRTKCWT
jgi:hypothetical protein